jgi:hypothetical protein
MTSLALLQQLTFYYSRSKQWRATANEDGHYFLAIPL